MPIRIVTTGLNVPQIVNDLADPVSELGSAAVDGIEAAPEVTPTGSWDFTGADVLGTVVDATTTAKGIVELATTTETTTGTDTVRAVTPAGVKAVGDTKVVAVTDGAKLWIGTQADYDAIGTKDAATLYAVT